MTESVDAHESDHVTARPDPGSNRVARFTWHFVQMLLAMLIGMMLLGPVWKVGYTWLGAVGLFTRPDVAALVMATNMTIGMTIWMRFRQHHWAPVAEMGAAMYLPFLLLLVPYWLGWLKGDMVMLGGHLLMLPAMLLAMLLRRDEYSRRHH